MLLFKSKMQNFKCDKFDVQDSKLVHCSLVWLLVSFFLLKIHRAMMICSSSSSTFWLGQLCISVETVAAHPREKVSVVAKCLFPEWFNEYIPGDRRWLLCG